ncbi:MAG: 7-cyano-7-deazaguanine synthase QueC [Pigmentiphaga sp.]|nr:7-cyano-7-deazaguanine synthase QueC [Pigmentiphaga sp.]
MKLDPNHAVVVLSGGQDSTTCLFWAAKRYGKVSAVTIDYGQRHAVELQAAQRVYALAKAQRPGVEWGAHVTAPVGAILQSSSPLVSENELEQYADYRSLPGGLEKTFVPLRNQLFLTIAANWAVHWGAGSLVTGVCQEDYGGYPDCREAFIGAVEEAINQGLGLAPDPEDPEYEYSVYPGQFCIKTPLMHLTKAQSVHLAREVGAMTALAFSHTSYDGQYPPTGKDHATLLRAKGFAEAGCADPLVARAFLDGLMECPDELRSPSDGSFIAEGGALLRSIEEAGAFLEEQGLL